MVEQAARSFVVVGALVRRPDRRVAAVCLEQAEGSCDHLMPENLGVSCFWDETSGMKRG